MREPRALSSGRYPRSTSEHHLNGSACAQRYPCATPGATTSARVRATSRHCVTWRARHLAPLRDLACAPPRFTTAPRVRATARHRAPLRDLACAPPRATAWPGVRATSLHHGASRARHRAPPRHLM